MDIDRFTDKAQEGIRGAHALAVRGGQQTIENEHLLAALLDQDGIVPAVLKKANLDARALHQNALCDLARLPKVSGSSDEPRVGPRLTRRPAGRGPRCSSRTVCPW